MPVEERNLVSQVNKFVDEYINKNNTEALKDLVTNDYVRTMNGKKVAGNPQELISSYEVFRTGFPDEKVTLSNIEVSGNDVFVNWTFTGTNNGEFNGMAPTGKKVQISGVSQLKYNGEGKCYREDVFFNELDMMKQLGYKLEKEAS